jgi:hypothetical protein
VTAVFFDGVGTPTTVIIVISGPESIAIIDVPSWWTPGARHHRAGHRAGICLLAFLWIGVLNARVRKQTRALTAQFERTARCSALDGSGGQRQRRHPDVGPQGAADGS